MCGMCPGVVGGCNKDECGWTDSDGKTRPKWFEIGDTYCEHLKIDYGHEVATTGDYYYGQQEEDDDETSY